VHLLGAFHRFVFFAEQREVVKSLAATKQRFPDLVADISLSNVDVREVEQWFGGLPEYVQIDLWTPPATRAYLASRTGLAFDTMLNIDLLSQVEPALGQWARRLLPPVALIQTDYPERFASACLPRGTLPERAAPPTWHQTLAQGLPEMTSRLSW